MRLSSTVESHANGGAVVNILRLNSAPLNKLRNTSRTPFVNTGNPNNQIRNHSAAIYFVKHFLPTAGVEIVNEWS